MKTNFKFLLALPKKLNKSVEELSYKLGMTKSAFIRHCITLRISELQEIKNMRSTFADKGSSATFSDLHGRLLSSDVDSNHGRCY